ncbi:MAG: hypothetical protein ACRC5R_03660 [Mycoplasmatales bacterium]
MNITYEKIINVFSFKCNAIRSKQLDILKVEKNKLFNSAEEQIKICTSLKEKKLIIEKYKMLVFKLEDKNNFQMRIKLEEETKKFLKAIHASIKLELAKLERNTESLNIKEDLVALRKFENTKLYKFEDIMKKVEDRKISLEPKNKNEFEEIEILLEQIRELLWLKWILQTIQMKKQFTFMDMQNIQTMEMILYVQVYQCLLLQ